MTVAGQTTLPSFTEEGVLPPGRYQCSPGGVKRRFVEAFSHTSNRSTIYDEWRSHRAAMKQLAPVLYQWIDGSFVTNKLNPSDIDVVTFVDGPAYDRLPRWRRDVITELCNSHGQLAYSRVDSYIVSVFPDGDHRSALYQSDRDYWSGAWSRFRPGMAKGYLEVR
ncbi:hypothetical protein SMD20_39810 [Nonomuraea sp. LP-02]|uniref:DUF6932 family protein n=1 Tax=Nonomuraea sp. LP-02 TaxID=3097960 RepID=UPI002E369635|nr:hypothetical protein [Nonomuraea sp. LP-02]MED7930427.1 hypothetical protein [Nonomuraea sp. LP-02]